MMPASSTGRPFQPTARNTSGNAPKGTVGGAMRACASVTRRPGQPDFSGLAAPVCKAFLYLGRTRRDFSDERRAAAVTLPHARYSRIFAGSARMALHRPKAFVRPD